MNPSDLIPSAVIKEDLVIGRGVTAEAGIIPPAATRVFVVQLLEVCWRGLAAAQKNAAACRRPLG